MIKHVLTFKALTTLLLGAVYLGGLVWGLVTGALDVQSFMAGIGPTFGAAMGFWFKGENGSEA